MIKFLLECAGILIVSFILTFGLGYLNCFRMAYNHAKKECGVKKPTKQQYHAQVKKERWGKYYEILKWHMIDIYRGRDFFDLYGVWAFCGKFGSGKTLGAVVFAAKLKLKYPQIHIATNFTCKIANSKITSWRDIINLPPWSVCIFDELVGTFNTANFADFPLELFFKLTKCRHFHLALFTTSPIYQRMPYQVKDGCDIVIECKNVLKRKRWFEYAMFDKDDYERAVDKGDKRLLNNAKFDKRWIVASDEDYSLYDTYEDVKALDVPQGESKKGKFNAAETEKLFNYLYAEKMKAFEAYLQKKYKLTA